ncbi:ceramide kinase [Drosophila guanche]|uniref:Blast:Ceramide kinase n=1 Tax=Drosophila guanche TaxID=7266 RepID=A0A3B0JN22_DROGU|nr:ceramide kinase [Drosophila guanche]XP_034130423.1 ceramide kinase [Drosophila guanche]SPP83637.1 blast:Ceramide kinase [Drosophila guanche]
MTQSKQSLGGSSTYAPCSSNNNGTCSSTTASAAAACDPSPSHDILLNNFQLKKKSYRVLLHGQQLVWERMQKVKQLKGSLEIKAPLPEDPPSPEAHRGYGPKSHILHLDDVISVRTGDTKIASIKPKDPQAINGPGEHQPDTRPTSQYLTINYALRLTKSQTDCNRWELRRLTFFNADPYIVRQWDQELQARVHQSSPTRMRVRRLLVFINPYGGRKAGSQTYERHVRPIFQLAGIDATCITTQRANQVRDILLSHDLSCYDAVCCVGGDGTVAEVINGLLFRQMRELGLDEQRPSYIPRPKIPVGVIPAGSTDTIAYSMHGTADVRTAAIHVILGQHRGLDVCSVSNSQTLLRFCASVLSYGYLGDVAAQSENYRWMGPKRYEYSGVKAFICNRGYDAELRLLEEPDLLPTPLEEHLPQSPDSVCSLGESVPSICYANCQRCSFASSIQEQQRSSLFVGEKDAEVETTSSAALEEADPEDSNLTPSEAALLRPRPRPDKLQLPVGSAPSMKSLASEQWKVIKGNFFMICGANITCACARSPNGISRYSHLGDGCLDLILVKKTSLLNNVRFLLNTAGRSGDIRNLPFVEVYRTRKFQFRTFAAASDESYSIAGSCQPIAQAEVGGSSSSSVYSSWNCDGEVVTDLDITMRSHCQLIEVFMRGPHSYSKPIKSGTAPSTPASSSDNVYCCCKD